MGDFMGILATGKRVSTTNIEIMRFADGKFAENWLESDTLGMMQQLGVIPTRCLPRVKSTVASG